MTTETVTTTTEPAATTDSSMPAGGLWAALSYWGLHAWILGYCVVMLAAFYIQFAMGEFPCPLCMLQRYGMILSSWARCS